MESRLNWNIALKSRIGCGNSGKPINGRSPLRFIFSPMNKTFRSMITLPARYLCSMFADVDRANQKKKLLTRYAAALCRRMSFYSDSYLCLRMYFCLFRSIYNVFFSPYVAWVCVFCRARCDIKFILHLLSIPPSHSEHVRFVGFSPFGRASVCPSSLPRALRSATFIWPCWHITK